MPMPVIAAAHGVALGGGLNIMSGADIRIIHPETRCAVMEMRWGLVPDMAGYPLWRGNVRDDVLRKLVYTNAEFSGLEACELGFATETAEDPLERAMALAEEIASKNPEAIRAARKPAERLVLLSEEGRQLNSVALAELLGGWASERLALVIGGADGHDPSLKQQADALLSLSALTFPHELARLMLVEQLYRTSTILQGGPYHRS